MALYEEIKTGNTQVAGAFIMTVGGTGAVYKPSRIATYKVNISPDTATVGSVAIEAKAYQSPDFQPVFDESGAAMTISLTATDTVYFDCDAVALRFTPTGADGTFYVAITVY